MKKRWIVLGVVGAVAGALAVKKAQTCKTDETEKEQTDTEK